jgi:2,3-bisphosphoglycerate-dependent phosphoglycerate mutase
VVRNPLVIVSIVLLCGSASAKGGGRIILMRHGESQDNQEKNFSGQGNPQLTHYGRKQAEKRGKKLVKKGVTQIDVAFSSALDRTKETAGLVLGAMGQGHVPIIAHPAINERDYGLLTGLPHDLVEEVVGPKMMNTWRRTFEGRPPKGESLKDVQARGAAYYKAAIEPHVLAGKTVLISTHGGWSRAFLGHLFELSPKETSHIILGNAQAVIIDMDANGKPVEKPKVLMPRPKLRLDPDLMLRLRELREFGEYGDWFGEGGGGFSGYGGFTERELRGSRGER